jgi:transposase
MILRPEDSRQLTFASRLDEVTGEPLVLRIEEVVNRFDLGVLYARYSERGTAFYDPAMMLKVWFLAYSEGECRSREVAKRVRYDVRYRFFAGHLRPDFRTLNRFRRAHVDLLAGYFAELVELCRERGLVDSSVLALDGTKLRANASGRRRKAKAQLQKQIAAKLAADAEAEGDTEDAASEERVVQVTEIPKERGAASDPDARMMKTSEGVLRLCYNAQVVVDRHQVIVAADVGMDADDKSSLVPLMEQAQGQVGEPRVVLADGGYFSGANLEYAQKRGWELIVPIPDTVRGGVFGQERFAYDQAEDRYRCPAGGWLTYRCTRHRPSGPVRVYRSTVAQCRDCPFKTACTRQRARTLSIFPAYEYRQRLRAQQDTAKGKAWRALRQTLVEPVFANIKFNLGFTRFSLRSLAKVRGEFLLMCIAHNLRKLAASRRPAVARTAAAHIAHTLSASCRNIIRFLTPRVGSIPLHRQIQTS